MAVPLDPIREFPCNIAGCYQSFDTEKEMKRHKVNEPTHFYCKKCNVDCNDWADLIVHKVEGMAPWIECRPDNRPEGNPPHIVCEFCGMDFKTMGGRLLHRDQRHQAAQSIMCPGCQNIFGRAGDMIAHLENDECSAIRDYEFYAQMQHKYVKKEIMKDLEAFTENLQINAAFASQPENPGLIEDAKKPAHNDTETDGGVILDESDEEQKKGHEPLEAKLAAVQLGDQKVTLRRSNLEAWPRLPGQAQSVVSSQVLNQSVGSPPPSIVGTDIPASEFASQITSRRGGMKVHTESYPSVQKSTTMSTPKHSANTIIDDDDDDATSVSTISKAEAVLRRPAAWTTTATSQALFGDVKATPPPAEIKSILKKREDEANQAPNLLMNARWWDPHSPDYTSDLFLHSFLQKYCCPFPTCDVDPFDHPHDIEGHLLDAHAKTQFRCPGCLKLFKRAQGMVSHMESTSKCPIRRSKDFKSVLDDITGGFIKAKRLPQPSIYRQDTAVVKSGQVVDGVMSTMYKAGWPNKK